MSEKIYLKVPSKPAANEVSHGNFHAVLTPGKVITVEDRRFADWLVREFALAEVDKPKGNTSARPKKKKAAKAANATPANTPASEPAKDENNDPEEDAGEEEIGGTN